MFNKNIEEEIFENQSPSSSLSFSLLRYRGRYEIVPNDDTVVADRNIVDEDLFERDTMAVVPLSDWMGSMAPSKAKNPLCNLGMSGSHDSFTYSLDPNSVIANDEPGWMQTVGQIPCVKRIIYNWSVTQAWSATDQLMNGIRYFDFRLSQPNDQTQPVCVVHGMYGATLSSLLDEINQFLLAHTKEVVILDFNHFYNINSTQHQQIVNFILSIFGSRLCPAPPIVDVNTLSLQDCWNSQYQVIAFDHGDDIQLPAQIWPDTYIQSPWANTDNVKDLLVYLEQALRSRAQLLPQGGFFITQGIRTPAAKDIIGHPFSTLGADLAIPTTKDVIQWLKVRGRILRPYMNIVMADFVDTANFCNLVISLN